LTACGPQSGNQRPADDVLIKGINQLVQAFESTYPKLKNWDDSSVQTQLHQKLPTGSAAEAGWHLIWPTATSKELSEVYVPWSLIGQIPESIPADTSQYSGGKSVPSSLIQDLRSQFLKMNKLGDYFAAITHVRYSTVNSKYIIFQTVPYLPVTDRAYGWASATSGSWKVLDYGTAEVGCGAIPANVQAEFGYTCP
jgi:hypothetical protein